MGPTLCSLLFFYFLKIEQKIDMPTPEHRGAVDHQASFLSSREEILQPGIEPLTSSLRFGHLSTTMQQLRVGLGQIVFTFERVVICEI